MSIPFWGSPDLSVRLSVFGLEKHPNLEFVTTSLQEIEGVRRAKLNTKKNIVKIVWRKKSRLTTEDLISALFRCGIAAEELA